MLCFSVLGHFEPQFFLLHLYQAIIYLAILIVLSYMKDPRAYMIGMLAPVAWLGVVFATSLLDGATRQFLRLTRGQGVTNEVSFIAAVSAVLSILMIVFCARHWKREDSGPGKTASTFAISVGVVALYYGILAIWFWNMIPTQIANG